MIIPNSFNACLTLSREETKCFRVLQYVSFLNQKFFHNSRKRCFWKHTTKPMWMSVDFRVALFIVSQPHQKMKWRLKLSFNSAGDYENECNKRKENIYKAFSNPVPSNVLRYNISTVVNSVYVLFQWEK